MGENDLEPLAKTRTRRSNAGARMHEMIFNAEDPQYAQAFGDLLKTDDDSSDDEEYIPKELESRNTNDQNRDGGDNDQKSDDDESNDDDDDSSDGSTASDEDSDDEDEEDDGVDEEDEDDEVQIINGISSHEKKFDSPRKRADITEQPGPPSSAAYKACKKICSVCLGDKSGDHDEIIDCDLCGVSVHEGCYGVISDNEHDDENKIHDDDTDDDCDSTAGSNISTEPWFCEPCRRSVNNPICELCPNLGGIFKETDTGRWVHMVCALYTRGVTFDNVNTLTEVSLFELNYGLYGHKTCNICEDRRLARSGICIECDAGLCKTVFHATCAQREGLLIESHSDEVDPYYAQCKQHGDKDSIKKKKKLFIALHARLRMIQAQERQSDRIKAKLSELRAEPDPHLNKYTHDNPPPIPKRVSRMLLTSPSIILRLNKKSELMGLDTKSAAMNVNDEMEAARQKWHVLPAFDLEFVAYCLDRTTRMKNMNVQNKELIRRNTTLKSQESNLREKFNGLNDVLNQLKSECETMMNEARSIQRSVTNITGKNYNLPNRMEQLLARCSFTKQSTSNGTNQVKANSTYRCGKCGTIKDQHLLSLCDTCKSHIHIYCLDPPLTRVPKKTKFGGWQCSDCTERDDDEEEEDNAQEVQNNPVDGPRKLRKTRENLHTKKFKSKYWN